MRLKLFFINLNVFLAFVLFAEIKHSSNNQSDFSNEALAKHSGAKAAGFVYQYPRGSEQRRRNLLYLQKIYSYSNFDHSSFKKFKDEHTKMSTEQYKSACVDFLLAGAIKVNLETGVPASFLVAQAVQESGWCRSKLSGNGYNFNGQKARKKHVGDFRFWPRKKDGKRVAFVDSYYLVKSSESSTGEGKKQVSKFMVFNNPGESLYNGAERLTLKSLPYGKCLPKRRNTKDFTNCVGKIWAVDKTYSEKILNHIKNLSLENCDLDSSELMITEDRFKL